VITSAWRALVLLTCGMLAAGELMGAEPTPTAGSPVIELPPYTVTDVRLLPPPEYWLYRL
jgi:hypothetical protein